MSDAPINPATLEYVKQQQTKAKKRRALVSVIGLLCVAGIAAGGYFGWSHYQQSKADSRIKRLAADPPKLFEAVQKGEIPWQVARETMRDSREQREQEQMTGFFKTPAGDRDEYLDKIIDEEQKRMQEWMKNRPTTWPTTRPDRQWPTTRPDDAARQKDRAAQQQARTDNTSPMQRAQQSEFRAAKRAREAARGIQGGGGRGPGGWGGGFGGGGGGRGRG